MKPLAAYGLALAALLALTAASFALSLIDLGPLGPVAALAVAGLKVAVVALVFMELRRASTPSQVALAITVAFVAVLCAGVLADVAIR